MDPADGSFRDGLDWGEGDCEGVEVGLEYPEEDPFPPKIPPPLRFQVPLVDDDQDELFPKLLPPDLRATAKDSPIIVMAKNKRAPKLSDFKKCFELMLESPRSDLFDSVCHAASFMSSH